MRDLLSKIGWSQAFFAGRVGVSVKTVNRWCKGGGGSEVAMAYLELVDRMLNGSP